MESLSSSQRKLLKRLRKHILKKSQLSDAEWDDIVYLGENGYIRFDAVYEDDTCFRSIDTVVIIKPLGKAVYESYIRTRNRWFIPVAISIAALIISVIALYKTSQPAKIYLNDKIIASAETTAATAAEKYKGKFGYLSISGIPLSQNGKSFLTLHKAR